MEKLNLSGNKVHGLRPMSVRANPEFNSGISALVNLIHLDLSDN